MSLVPSEASRSLPWDVVVLTGCFAARGAKSFDEIGGLTRASREMRMVVLSAYFKIHSPIKKPLMPSKMFPYVRGIR